MPKFILIDHSITDFGGHHYEYALRVLQAAGRAGYTPVLATNRQFKEHSAIPFLVLPVYHHGFWFRAAEPRFARTIKAIRQWLFRKTMALQFSSLGVLWLNRNDPAKLVKHTCLMPPITLLFVGLGFYLFKVCRAAFRAIKLAIPFRGYFKTLLSAIWLFVRVLASPFIPSLWPSWIAELLGTTQRLAHSFGKDTLRLFRQVRLQEGDVVFIPTLGEQELLGLLDYFSRDPYSKLATWHLLFRRNIYQNRDPEYDAQDEELRPLKNAFRRFQEGLAGQRVYFYTDTEQLTQQYNRLNVGTFQTVPIPVDAEYRAPFLPLDNSQPLRITYIGDARTEKGYHHIPRIVQDLWIDYVQTAKIKFVIQSNFNIPQGEAGVVVARAQLQQYPADCVQLIPNALTTVEYRNLILSSDLILILYEPNNYYARSSGIFVEALVAGVPVLVPAGTWMALQLARSISQYHRSLREEKIIVRTRHGHQVRWHTQGEESSSKESVETLILRANAAHSCWLACPPGATHLLISFRQISSTPGQFVRIHLEQLDKSSRSVGTIVSIVGDNSVPNSTLFPLKPGARRLWLGFTNAFSTAFLEISDIRMDFICETTGLPLSAAGVIYSQPDDISKSVREIINHITHYRATASQFSTEWSNYHNPDCLVAHLLNPKKCSVANSRFVSLRA